jgi:hypothetical protein
MQPALLTVLLQQVVASLVALMLEVILTDAVKLMVYCAAVVQEHTCASILKEMNPASRMPRKTIFLCKSL